MVLRHAFAATLALMPPTLALAQDVNPNVHARQAFMDVMAYNLGQIGGMAQGRRPYDAGVAATAAANLDALAQVDIRPMFPAGTDDMSIDHTRALPAIWDNPEGFVQRIDALRAATATMRDAAGVDLASLQAAMRPLGAACGGCHQTFRTPQQ